MTLETKGQAFRITGKITVLRTYTEDVGQCPLPQEGGV